DNIPGVSGIGEKTAVKLLQQYGTLDQIYDHIDEIKGALQKRLITGKEDAEHSRYLATIKDDVPLEISWDEFQLKGINVAVLKP
ncbi:5'-3' exonuclease H3TH domain-containing protein, partial [Tritonibacter sp. SIMBA_163]|uniref:5'-3' exonuclease H3TH domain-containing protein n=1 Tax=Tritonibacter sp. SIMBA_163 TaxID=3080868 RepID=UPI00397EAFAD